MSGRRDANSLITQHFLHKKRAHIPIAQPHDWRKKIFPGFLLLAIQGFLSRIIHTDAIKNATRYTDIGMRENTPEVKKKYW